MPCVPGWLLRFRSGKRRAWAAPCQHVNLNHVDKYVLDNGQGGTGQRFDWSLLNGEALDNVLLAGGLSPDNCVEAAKTGCAGLDFNSGVESQPGIKDASKLASVFKTLRAY